MIADFEHPGAGDRFVDLLRHGSVAGGARFRGTTDDVLSAGGWKEMRVAAAGQRHWDGIVSSPARRCAAFAEELAGQRGIPLLLMPELAERGFGAWESRLASEIPLSELGLFWEDPVGYTPPGGEPFGSLCGRVEAGWLRVLGSELRAPLLVTHGGVVRVILGLVLGVPAEALLRIEVPPACRTRLRVPAAGKPSLMHHGGPHPCGAPS